MPRQTAHPPAPVRPPLVADLRTVLANTAVLAGKTQAARWNGRGPAFTALHGAFAAQHAALIAAEGALSARLRALGEPVPAGLGDLVGAATLDHALPDGEATVLAILLARDHRVLAAGCAQAATLAGDHDDHATANLLIARSAEHEKTGWMLEAAGQGSGVRG